MDFLNSKLVASGMFALGCGLLTAFLLRCSYRYFGKRKAHSADAPIDSQPRPSGKWSGAYSDSSALIERQKVEIYDLGRELKAQLDGKIIVLEELCQRSQQQIDRLETLLADSAADAHADSR